MGGGVSSSTSTRLHRRVAIIQCIMRFTRSVQFPTEYGSPTNIESKKVVHEASRPRSLLDPTKNEEGVVVNNGGMRTAGAWQVALGVDFGPGFCWDIQLMQVVGRCLALA